MKNPFRRQAPNPPTPPAPTLLQRNPIWWRMYEESGTPDTQYLHPTAQARPSAANPYAEANAIIRGGGDHE